MRISCINKLISSYTSGATCVEYQVKVQTWNGKCTTTTNMSHCLPSGVLGRHQWPFIIFFFFSFEIIVSLRILPNRDLPKSQCWHPWYGYDESSEKETIDSKYFPKGIDFDLAFDNVLSLWHQPASDNKLECSNVHTLKITLNIHLICYYVIIMCALLILLTKSLIFIFLIYH